MRRPLNGNGAPFHFGAPGVVEIFDTENFGLDQVYAVTLYLWSVNFVGAVSALAVDTVNQPSSGIESYTATTLDKRRANGSGAVKLVDRLVLRGQQKLLYGVTAYGGSPQWLWGFFERQGKMATKPELRPLQPTNNLKSPFNAFFPALAVTAGGGDVEQVIQQLDDKEERTDLFTLTMQAAVAANDVTDGTASLIIPGLAVPVSIPVTNAILIEPVPLFDEIPIGAIGSSPADSQIKLSVSADSTETVLAAGYGRFNRQ